MITLIKTKNMTTPPALLSSNSMRPVLIEIYAISPTNNDETIIVKNTKVINLNHSP